MKTRDKILKIIRQNSQMSVNEITLALDISRQYVHRVLLDLEEENLIVKVGIAPKVYYSALEAPKSSLNEIITYENEMYLNKHFITIDPLGNKLEGLSAMVYWCERQNLPLIKTVDEFIQTKEKYNSFFNEAGLINGTEKLRTSKGIGNICVDELYYLDFYAIERFGKTRLGTLMHYAKQGQNKDLIKIIVKEVKQRILSLTQTLEIDAVLFVPPTISRKIQIMNFLEKYLALNIPSVKIDKIKTPIIVPQKALSKIFERVSNAKNTFFVPHQKKCNHVLIIDDAVGSGATINEIACKIKEKEIAIKVTGLAITGSYKGFEVISEL